MIIQIAHITEDDTIRCVSVITTEPLVTKCGVCGAKMYLENWGKLPEITGILAAEEKVMFPVCPNCIEKGK